MPFVLILAIGSVYFLRSGWPSGKDSIEGRAAEGPGYMYYAGPVFPLSLEEADDDISSERDIHFDFSSFSGPAETYFSVKINMPVSEVCSPECLVSDSYILSNQTGMDKTLTLLYPFAASLNSSPDVKPVITVDGTPVESECFTGPASAPPLVRYIQILRRSYHGSVRVRFLGKIPGHNRKRLSGIRL